VLLLLLGVGIKTSGASALGLPDGTYSIEVDFPDLFDDLSGTITIGPAPSFVTAFDAGVFNCTDCNVGPSTPDTVDLNDGSAFRILDAGTNLLLTLSTGGSAFIQVNCPPDLSCNFAGGDWRVVPEPISSTLLLSGIGVLALRSRMRRKEN
jgi:hypothetical protein